jgi:hypothetical protein
MKSTKLMLGIWVAALLLAAAPAQAQSTVEECQTQLGIIHSDLDANASLSSKLQAASAKLDQGKYADALRKLADFQDAVIAMRDVSRMDARLASLRYAGTCRLRGRKSPLQAVTRSSRWQRIRRAVPALPAGRNQTRGESRQRSWSRTPGVIAAKSMS